MRTWNIGTVYEVENTISKRGIPCSVTFTDGVQIVVGRRGGIVEVLNGPMGQEVMKACATGFACRMNSILVDPYCMHACNFDYRFSALA